MMNPENTKKLFEKYPKLFPAKDRSSPKKSLMFFGFECGDGWVDLIDKLYVDIQARVDVCRKKGLDCQQARVTQVKEKFGGLRCYYDGGDKKIADLVEKAEKASFTICGLCGRKRKPTTTGDWITTLCSSCQEKGRRMEPKFKRGETVTFKFDELVGAYTGKIVVIDWIPREGWRYDIMCTKPRRLLIKHTFEKELIDDLVR